jgi:predicted transcriptional regulator
LRPISHINLAEQNGSVKTTEPSVSSGPDRSYGIVINGRELRRQRLIRGLTGADLARRARVAATTVSHAENGRPIHPRKLYAIVAILAEREPIPGFEAFSPDIPGDGPQ